MDGQLLANCQLDDNGYQLEKVGIVGGMGGMGEMGMFDPPPPPPQGPRFSPQPLGNYTYTPS